MHILHQTGEGEVHGAWRSQELAEPDYSILPGTLYPLLHRMEQEGLLGSRPRPEDGRVRRIDTITRAGREEPAGQRRAPAESAREILGGEVAGELDGKTP